jgi:hypothetical protein
MPEIAPPDASKRKIAQGPEVEKECSAIEVELAELKAVYEQYFLGLERQPPTNRHQALKRRIQQLKASFVQQTSLKFRVGNLYQKYLTYERLWERTLKEMEDGIYRRDLYKARRRAEKLKPAVDKSQAAKAAERPAADDFDVDEDMSELEAPPAAPVPAAPRPANGTVRPPARPQLDANALSDDKVRAIFNAYVSAKKRCNEDVSKLSFDGVAQNLRKQVPALLKQHNAKAIEFKIVIRDGKAILKAVPKT